MQDFTVKDISDSDTFNMLRGYRTLKNGTEKLLTKSAIYGIFKRSDNLPFWSDLTTWNNYVGSEINTAFAIPQSGSLDYVMNSIKSLFSTMGKHYGSVNAKTLISAFSDSNTINIEKKQVSLLEDSFNKQIDWFEKIDTLSSNGVLNVPDYKKLESEIFQTLVIGHGYLTSSTFSDDIINRIESRANFASSPKDVVATRDIAYLENLINKTEGQLCFP